MSAVARRRRVVAVAAAAGLALVLAVVLFARGGGGDNAPIADRAASLVPSDALVWVHVSTDGDRASVQHARDLAARFPSYGRLRESLLRRLSVRDAEVQSWLGDEAGLALLDSPSGTAASLVVLDSRDDKAARRFVSKGALTETYKDIAIYRYRAVSAALVDGFVVIGQPDVLHRVIDIADDDQDPGLAGAATYKKALDGLPADRFADAYASAGGVRRILDPAGGLLGAAGTLLDRPGLQAAGVALSADGSTVQLNVHSLSSPGKPAFPPFEPTLADDVPSGALAYIGVKGFDRAIGRLLGLGSGSLGQLVTRVRPLLAPLRGEVAIFAMSRAPAPILTVIAAAPNEGAVEAALAKLGGTHSKVAGVDVTTVRAGAFTLSAAAFDKRLVLSTSPDGIAAVKDQKGSLTGDRTFKSVVGSTSGQLSSLVFLDFDQLLRLGEQTGLNDSRAYRQVRDDLRQVRAIGARSAGGGGNTTAEIRFSLR